MKGPKDPSSGKPKNNLSTLKLGSLYYLNLILYPYFRIYLSFITEILF